MNVVLSIPNGRKIRVSIKSMNGTPAARESARPSIPKPMLEYEYSVRGGVWYFVVGIEARTFSSQL